MDEAMRPARGFDIRDAVDLTVLQRIQDTFARAMHLAALMVDVQGRPITRPSNFVSLCQMIRSTPAGFQRCAECDVEGGQVARERQAPHVYVCKGGLMDIAAPIIIEGEFFGSVHCGQVVPSDERQAFVVEVIRRNVDLLGIPQDQLRRVAEAIPAVPRDRIDAAAELLALVANYVVEVGLANLAQSRLLAEERHRAALQAELQTAQLHMLQSQVNPHFLFNALGLIGYTAIEENAPRTEEIAYSLGDLLRYSLRNAGSLATLGQEADIIGRYLAIQRLRFGERLQVIIEIDPWLRQTRMPCMVLQPLVENAVLHAVEPQSQPVTVRVAAAPVAAGLQLTVADDGPGMPPALVESLNVRNFVATGSRPALGVQNVVRRLELQYGAQFEFKVESTPGRGTQVILVLPVFNGPAVSTNLGVDHVWPADRR